MQDIVRQFDQLDSFQLRDATTKCSTTRSFIMGLNMLCMHNGYSSVIVCESHQSRCICSSLDFLHFSGMGLSVAMSTLVLDGTRAVSSSGKSGMGSRQQLKLVNSTGTSSYLMGGNSWSTMYVMLQYLENKRKHRNDNQIVEVGRYSVYTFVPAPECMQHKSVLNLTSDLCHILIQPDAKVKTFHNINKQYTHFICVYMYI